MKQKLSIALSLISVFLTLFLSFNLKTSYAVNDSYPVTICHATGSAENPYNTLHVNSNAIGGHFENPGTPKSGHEDDILFAGEVECPGPVQNTPFPTNPDYPECNEETCPVATPTNPPTPTPGGGTEIIGNIDLPCILNRCPSPTVAPSPTTAPSSAPTATPTDSPRGGSNGDGGSSGGGSSSSSSSSSSTGGSVLGATTMAPTGTFLDTLFNGVATVGLLFLGLATIQYGKEKSL